MCVCGHMSVPGHMRGLRAQRPLRNIPQERLCGRSRQSPWPQDTAPPESSVAAENTLEHALSAQPQAPEAWGSSGHAQDTLTRSAWGPGHHPGCAGEGVRALIGKEGRGRGPGPGCPGPRWPRTACRACRPWARLRSAGLGCQRVAVCPPHPAPAVWPSCFSLPVSLGAGGLRFRAGVPPRGFQGRPPGALSPWPHPRSLPGPTHSVASPHPA